MNIWLLKAIFLVGIALTFVIRGPYYKANRANKMSDVRKTAQEKALLAGAFAGMFALPVFHALTPLLAFADYAQPPWMDAAGIVVWLAMLWLFWKSHHDLGANWSATLEVREGHKLITDGVYQKIRHPMYAACWLWAIGQGLLLRNWIAGWAGLMAFGTLYFLRVAKEERMMLDHFGEQYRSYTERTGRLLPKF
ncbi:MAG: protein-S-isoprenylcysteine O-methyltransferase [Acidobacteria bacterium]|nr:protein-S-isoprenylcysteine O-methyltransferase [Acidobacteriota bacterium]